MERGSEDRWRTTSSFIRLPSLNLPSCVFQDTEKQQQAAHRKKKEQKKNFKTFLIHTQINNKEKDNNDVYVFTYKGEVNEWIKIPT